MPASEDSGCGEEESSSGVPARSGAVSAWEDCAEDSAPISVKGPQAESEAVKRPASSRSVKRFRGSILSGSEDQPAVGGKHLTGDKV